MAMHVARAAGGVVQRAIGAADGEAGLGQHGDECVNTRRVNADELEGIALGDAEVAFGELVSDVADARKVGVLTRALGGMPARTV